MFCKDCGNLCPTTLCHNCRVLRKERYLNDIWEQRQAAYRREQEMLERCGSDDKQERLLEMLPILTRRTM